MEGMMFDSLAQWLLYCLGALGCYWAWVKIFFWLSNRDGKYFVRLLGAVLFFTPVPVSLVDDRLAPAWIALLFRAFLEQGGDVFTPIIWLLAALMGGLLALSAYTLAVFLKSRYFTQNAQE